MTSLPSISIVSPSFNQAAFVRKMLQSIELQATPPLEHLIYDAGSTDGTLEILRDYAKEKKNVVLEVGKDSGQANAINLGFAAAKGDIIAWLNTDDWYLGPDVLTAIAEVFSRHPDIDIVYGRGDFVSAEGKRLRSAFINTDADQLKDKFIGSVGILQPALFMRRETFARVGPLREDMSFAFDYEYWVRAAFLGMKFLFFDRLLCEATLHPNSKTMGSRETSLRESALVVREHYGFAPYQWVDRLADAIVYKADGIISKPGLENEDKIRHRREEMATLNPGKAHIAGAFSKGHFRSAGPTLRYFAEEFGIDTSRTIVSSFNSDFFEAGLTMIAGVRRTSGAAIPIFVYDLGLSLMQREFVNKLKNVFVLDFPRSDFSLFDGYLSPSTYGFKTFANWHIRQGLEKGDCVLWLDAGLCPLRDLDEIFRRISKTHFFIVDHDDKSIWPFENMTFATDACIRGMEATNAELAAPHLRAGILGYRVGSRYDKLLDKAFEYSLDETILVGEKHLSPADQLNRAPASRRREVAADRRRLETLSHAQMRELFGFYGHRHDQTIYSILAARFGLHGVSACRYCVADETSSAVSKENWKSGNQSAGAVGEMKVSRFYLDSGAVVMQHRGTYRNFSGLEFEGLEGKKAIILGNGPSLKGFDFARLAGVDVFGMNAAYRYWDEIGWYPQYYSCLDLVVGLSHKTEIARLISKADEYGIRLFLLRDNLIRELGDLPNAERIVNFDENRRGNDVLSAYTVTTGSHTAAWAVTLGYRDIFLLGIDCNYVEVVSGAARGRGTELEIVEDSKNNPNYFFDDYQRKGDKYNVPNPERAIHLDSWREVAALIDKTPAVVLNANTASKVDAFDFCTFEDVEKARDDANYKITLIPGQGRRPAGAGKIIVGRTFFGRSDKAHIDETQIIAKLAARKNSGVMLDVGAHFGGSARPFVKRGWRVYCFEPDPINRKNLLASFGSEPNVTIDPRGVGGEARSSVPLYRSNESTGISGLTKFRDTHEQVASVDVVTLENVVSEYKLDRVDFLKIDVEGLDFAVLKGMPWDRVTPEIVEIEFEDARSLKLDDPFSMKDIADFLNEKGYVVYVSEWHPIIRYGVRHEWCGLKRYPCRLDSEAAWGNLLAFQKDPGDVAIAEAATQLLELDGQQPRTLLSKLIRMGKSMLVKASGPVAGLLRNKSPFLYRIARKVAHERAVFAPIGLVAFAIVLPIVLVLLLLPSGLGFWSVALFAVLAFGLVFGAMAVLGLVTRLHIDKLHQSITRERRDEMEGLRSDLQGRMMGSPFPNMAAFQHFNRGLDQSHIDILINKWGKLLGLELTPKSLRYMSHRVGMIEANLHGRLATNVEDALLRALVAAGVKDNDLRVLEIGSLFGAGLAIIHDYCHSRFKSVHLTVMDPLEGYYGENKPDILTQEPVTEQNLRRNLAAALISDDEYTLIKHFSTAPEALAEASRSTYNLLVIDGDHSYDGVAWDYRTFKHLVSPGGFIIIDDYGSADWPDIKVFVDKEVIPNPDLEFLGASWRTAVFRVIGSKNADASA